MVVRVTETSARGAEGPEHAEDAAGSGRHADIVADAGRASGERHGPGGAHS